MGLSVTVSYQQHRGNGEVWGTLAGNGMTYTEAGGVYVGDLCLCMESVCEFEQFASDFASIVRLWLKYAGAFALNITNTSTCLTGISKTAFLFMGLWAT